MVVAFHRIACRAQYDSIEMLAGTVRIDVDIDAAALIAVGGESTDRGDFSARERTDEVRAAVEIHKVVAVEAADVETEVIHHRLEADRDCRPARGADGEVRKCVVRRGGRNTADVSG